MVDPKHWSARIVWREISHVSSTDDLPAPPSFDVPTDLARGLINGTHVIVPRTLEGERLEFVTEFISAIDFENTASKTAAVEIYRVMLKAAEGK